LTVADHLIEPTRHAALFALDQGAVPADRRDRVRQYLLAHPPADNNIMQYYYYFKQQFAADDAGQDVDFLHTLRTQWQDMAESPYEATFEGLHSWGSQAHGYGMFPAYFLSAYVLGVRRDGAVQQKSLLIEPRLGDLTAAAGTVVTEFGVVPVSWTRAGAQWNFAVEVPAGPTTRLRLPVGPGRYSATLDGRPVESRTRLDGRWLEIKLPAGRHAGSWSSAG
jgi:hypothetical protein